MFDRTRALYWIVSTVFAILGFPGNGYGHTINDTNTLLEDLFVTRKYNKYVRPVTDQLKPLKLAIEFHVTSLNSVDVNSGGVAVWGFLQLVWHDEQLTWNPGLYGGLYTLQPKPDNIWLPTISQYSHTVENSYSLSSSPLWLSHEGQVGLYWIDRFVTTCKTDIFLYPFDSHTCQFLFLSFVHTDKEQFFVSSSDTIKSNGMAESNEWAVNMQTCDVTSVLGDGVNMSSYTCRMLISRRHSFGVHHIVMPFICLTVLTFAVFWTPVNSGERISFSVTLFLAYIVQLSSLTNEIPRNDNASLYSRLLVFMNVMNVACVVLSVIVTRLSLSSRAHIPRYLQTITRCIVLKRDPLKVFPTPDENENQGNTADVLEFTNEKVDANEQGVTWLEVAQAVDTAMFLFALAVVLLTIIVIVSIGITHI